MDKEPQGLEKTLRLLCLVGALFALLFLLVSPRDTWAEPPAPAPTGSVKADEAPAAAPAEPSESPDAAPSTAPAGTPEAAPSGEPDKDEKADKPGKGDKPAAKTYVGRKTCEECHEDYKDTFHRTLHAKDPSTSPTAANQCESCHGPGSVHAEDNEPSSIVSPKRLKPVQVNAICQKCHESTPGQYEWRFSKHAQTNTSCTDCHQVHPKKKADLNPKLLRKAEEKDLCYTCHAEVKGQTFMPSHHPIEEGRVTCSDCHNVHGSQLSQFKNAPNARELCLSCHQNYRGPFAVEHQPVSDDCGTCHRAHGSYESNLLTMSEPFLCQRCHATVHNPHVSPVLTPPDQLGNQALMFSRCTVCHFNVHGSQQGPSLTR